METVIENDDHRTPLMVREILRHNPQQAIGRTLVPPGSRPKESKNCPFVRFVRCSRFLLDPTNLVGSSKQLEDWLVKAGFIKDDGPHNYDVETSQIQVGTAAEEGTSITISYR
jgi:hypothetical protein